MNLQQLYYFKTTAELEHYTRAAQDLNISQSCLSHSITDLEQELGVSLFVRQGRNVRLTKCGAFFLEYVTQALNTLDEGRERLQDFISSDTGIISIGHLSSLSDFVPYLISRFFADTGKIHTRFQFSQGSTLNIENQLLEGTTDLAITTPFENSHIESVKIGEHRTVLIVSRSHPLAAQDSVDLTTLGQETFITYHPQCQIRTHIDRIFQYVGISPYISFEAINDPIILGAVAAGLGVALVSEAAGAKSDDLKALRIENDIPTRDIHVAWCRNRYMTPAAKNFRDFILENDLILNEYKEHIKK
ncbi:MAG: LysR family transcriptional regulator [Lachnospiraceae bacterium]|nr:LysR family transcriptional regulator [Lachnospiraceae bacterium]